MKSKKFNSVFYLEQGARLGDRVIKDAGWYWYFCADTTDNYGIDYGDGPFATDEEANESFTKWKADNPSPKLSMSELRG